MTLISPCSEHKTRSKRCYNITKANDLYIFPFSHFPSIIDLDRLIKSDNVLPRISNHHCDLNARPTCPLGSATRHDVFKRGVLSRVEDKRKDESESN